MAHSSRAASDHSLPVPVLRWLCRAVASLRLAVVLIATVAVVLAYATLIDKWYGEAAARFAVYGAWWFIGLNVLLAMNVLASALIRLPWKRRQTGFVITHLGILVLLTGCLVYLCGGVQAMLSAFEGYSSHRAYEESQHFELNITRTDESAEEHRPPKMIKVPFASGPFNWEDYRQKLWWLPWGLARRSRGVIYDRQGIKLEVLDYCSDSRWVGVPNVTLRVAGPAAEQGVLADESATRLTLAVLGGDSPHAAMRPQGIGQSEPTPQGPSVAFWMTASPAETEAFLRGLPEGSLGRLGQVVFCTAGQVFRLPVAKLQEQSRQPLGETGLEVELIKLDFQPVRLYFRVHGPEATPQPMTIFADHPQYNLHDRQHGVFGGYWLDVSAVHEAVRDDAKPPAGRDPRQWRIDVIQGHDQRLYYRTWSPPRVAKAAAWPAHGDDPGDVRGTKIVAFGQSATPLAVYLERFTPAARPGRELQPRPFAKQPRRPQPRACVRLSVDSQTEEFWLAVSPGDTQGDQQQTVQAPKRQVTITMPRDAIELGFEVHLHEFCQKLDPGSGEASHYSSRVDFLPRREEVPPGHPPLKNNAPREPLQEDVIITLNAPVDFRDPQSGRSYRFFQSGFDGPWRPGSAEFDQLAGRQGKRDRLYLSRLSVNYDPGRGLKYAGSLLLVVGIVITIATAVWRGLRGTPPQRQPAVPIAEVVGPAPQPAVAIAEVVGPAPTSGEAPQPPR